MRAGAAPVKRVNLRFNELLSAGERHSRLSSASPRAEEISPMHVVAFCSQERGSGKSTLSAHLAAQAELSGAGPVALIDTAPQGVLAAWRNARRSATPVCSASTVAKLPSALARLRQEGFGLVLIDTPSALGVALQGVLNGADLVVVPIRPGRHDVHRAAGMVDMAGRAQCGIVFAINAANLRAKIAAEVAIALAQHGTVLPTFVQHRADFAAAMLDGRTAQELAPSGRAAREIELLWDGIAAQLDRQARRQVIQPIGMASGRRASASGATR
jgi:chromosome partitioning protein